LNKIITFATALYKYNIDVMVNNLKLINSLVGVTILQYLYCKPSLVTPTRFFYYMKNKKKSIFKKIYLSGNCTNVALLANAIEVSNVTIYRWLKEIKVK
jgi:hypothetical protein